MIPRSMKPSTTEEDSKEEEQQVSDQLPTIKDSWTLISEHSPISEVMGDLQAQENHYVQQEEEANIQALNRTTQILH